MFDDISVSLNDSIIHYPILDSSLPFSEYIARCRAIISERRLDLQHPNNKAEMIIDANSPFELIPETSIKKGALLVHGLFDCPFSLKELGKRLQTQGVLCKSVLLPGHGTKPEDLIHVSYHDWIQAVTYGIESLRQQVDQIYLIGYSTGAALAVYHALQNSQIRGVVLLAPAIKIKAPVDIVVIWHSFLKYLNSQKQWMYKEEELDYAKYLSIPFNAVVQVTKLTEVIGDLHRERPLDCPVFMAMSREDETISSHTAIDFFSSLNNASSKLLLYSAQDHIYPDSRIEVRSSRYPSLNIQHFSHVSLPFSAENFHYGQYGDYIRASHIKERHTIYGAYNRIEENAYDALYKFKLTKKRRAELTYNPDFYFMANAISKFVWN